MASAGYCDYGHVKTSSQLSDLFSVTVVGAPSRIRTCARGSGGGLCDLANLCSLPACTRSLFPQTAKIIPCIFRILAIRCRPIFGFSGVAACLFR